ncbi:MAG: hypothetical protein IAF58_07800, partial [Leptolyngbya sp.]|nr:hypothetical protein [Candidatus Melainabacteria bacterium]
IVLNLIIAGVAERHLGNRPAANKHFEDALRRSEEISYDWGKACAYGNLGNMQQEFSSHSETEDDAISSLNKAAELHKNAEFYSELVKDKIGIAQDYGNQAIVMMDQWCINYKPIDNRRSLDRQKLDREFDQAKKLYDERIRMAIEDINDFRGAANGYGNLATLHLERYRVYSHKESIGLIENAYLNAINWHKSANNLRGIAANEGNLGRAYRIIHSIKGGQEYSELSKFYLDSSLKHFREIGDSEAIYIAQANILAWHLVNNDFLIMTMREKVKIQGEKCGRNISDESELWNLKPKQEPSRLRHLSDKYGKLHSVDFFSYANSSYPFADRILHSKSLCLEHLQLSLASAYEANTMRSNV